MSLPSSLQGLYWKLSWYSNGHSLVCNYFLSLMFNNLIMICLSVCLFGFILFGPLSASWTWVSISFTMLGKSLAIISSNMFSVPFSFSFSSTSGSPMVQILVRLMSLQRFSYGIHILFNSFFFFLIFQLGDFYSPVLLTADPFCIIWSDVDSHQCIFHFSCYILHFW